MITYVTDVKEGETDILAECRYSTLSIRDMQGNELAKIMAPVEGWTHERLCAVQPENIQDGADAYLASTWIGSTEV